MRREHDVRFAPATHFDGGLIARRVAIDLGAQIRGRSDGMACKLVHDIVGLESRARLRIYRYPANKSVPVSNTNMPP